MDPDVGASACASGSHMWKGTRGIFIAKLKNKNIHNILSRSNVITGSKLLVQIGYVFVSI